MVHRAGGFLSALRPGISNMAFNIQHDRPTVSKPAKGMAELEWFTARRVR
jgi:hypothetical protein